MKMHELRNRIKSPIFFDYDVPKVFSGESKSSINVQLSRMSRNGTLSSIKRGLYMFRDTEVDPYIIANYLYRPSYVSLESALNYYGIMPDIPAAITSVTTITTKRFSNKYGLFLYSKIATELYDYFSILRVRDARSQLFFEIARPEKALLDFIYIRRVNSLRDYRIELKAAIEADLINPDILNILANKFPTWVREVVNG